MTITTSVDLNDPSIFCLFSVENRTTTTGLLECYVPRKFNVFIHSQYGTSFMKNTTEAVCIWHNMCRRVAMASRRVAVAAMFPARVI